MLENSRLSFFTIELITQLTAFAVNPSELHLEFSSFDCCKAFLMLPDSTEIIPQDKNSSRYIGTKKWNFSVQNFERILGKSSWKFVVLEAKFPKKLALQINKNHLINEDEE